MKARRLILGGSLLLCCTMNSLSRQREVPKGAADGALPPGATHCDLSIPLQIDLTPISTAQPGQPRMFQVDIESGLDPDLIRNMWVEYEYPENAFRFAPASTARQELKRSGHNRLEFGVVLPGMDRYRIRARLMVQLNDGHLISKTATQWINADTQAPEGMIGRIENPDGTGIRVYQGVTVR